MIVGIDAMDKIVIENLQNIEKLQCQNHWAKESWQKWDTQKEQENQASQRKSLSLVRIDAMDKIVTENWQNIEKLHCQNHWAIKNQDKNETHRRNKKIKEAREKS